MVLGELGNGRLLVVGNPEPIHVGAHVYSAAKSLGLVVSLCDARDAFRASRVVRKLNWWFGGRRPPLIRSFSEEVVDVSRRCRPRWLLSIGISPLDAEALDQIGRLGVRRLNYLTDDPWNPAHHASWFIRALPFYDHIFSPRQANVADLNRVGCRYVSYLPFAYAPELHFIDPPAIPAEAERFESDVVFAGGADQDRVPYIEALAREGIRLALYGGYWGRYPKTRGHWRGHADPYTLRKAIGGAKVALCLVRRMNRDGSCMRTFEVPAMGGCMLTEDTEEHRRIFGPDGENVIYFRSPEEMIERLRWLLQHEAERARLAHAANRLIVGGKQTYVSRLSAMLDEATESRGT